MLRPTRRRKLAACAVCTPSLSAPLRSPIRALPAPLKFGAERVLIAALHVYRDHISPGMPRNCRFVPSCSVYMIEALEKFGGVRGSILSVWRLLRCNPAGGRGVDEPRWPPVAFGAGTFEDL